VSSFDKQVAKDGATKADYQHLRSLLFQNFQSCGNLGSYKCAIGHFGAVFDDLFGNGSHLFIGLINFDEASPLRASFGLPALPAAFLLQKHRLKTKASM
jgi:hypothetical protein